MKNRFIKSLLVFSAVFVMFFGFAPAYNVHAADKKCESINDYYLIQFGDGAAFRAEVSDGNNGSEVTLTPVRIENWEAENTVYEIISGDTITQTSALTAGEVSSNFCGNFMGCTLTDTADSYDVLLCSNEAGSGGINIIVQTLLIGAWVMLLAVLLLMP